MSEPQDEPHELLTSPTVWHRFVRYLPRDTVTSQPPFRVRLPPHLEHLASRVHHEYDEDVVVLKDSAPPSPRPDERRDENGDRQSAKISSQSSAARRGGDLGTFGTTLSATSLGNGVAGRKVMDGVEGGLRQRRGGGGGGGGGGDGGGGGGGAAAGADGWVATSDVHRSKAEATVVKRFRVYSMNVFGLPIADWYEARLKHVEKLIAVDWADADLIVLQEAWFWQSREAFVKAASANGLYYSHYFCTGIGVPIWPNQHGSGILVMSRYPIVDTVYHRFTANGKSYRFDHMDAHAGKGVGLVRVLVPGYKEPFDVFTTHMIGYYHPKGFGNLDEDQYLAHRVSQSYEMTKFVHLAARGPLVLLVGDFNSPHDSICVNLPKAYCQLEDSFHVVHPEAPGHTIGTKQNIFSANKLIPQKIDHILFRSNVHRVTHLSGAVSESGKDERIGWSSARYEWKPVAAAIVDEFVTYPDTGKYMYTEHEGRPARIPVSDHLGVSAEFELVRAEPDEEVDTEDDTEAGERRQRVLAETETWVRLGVKEAGQRRLGHILRFAFSLLLLIFLWWYLLFTEEAERRQQHEQQQEGASELAAAVEAGGRHAAAATSISPMDLLMRGFGLAWGMLMWGFTYVCSHTWIPKVMLFLGLPYATVEFILGIFEVQDEFLVMKEIMQSLQVDRLNYEYHVRGRRRQPFRARGRSL